MAQGNDAIPQGKRNAMGMKVTGMKTGGSVPCGGGKPLKTGIPDSPITKSKMGNGIPGMKKGGPVEGMEPRSGVAGKKGGS